MDFAKTFGSNPKKDEEGVRFELSSEAWVLVARAGNKRSRDYAQRVRKPFTFMLSMDTPAKDAKELDLMIDTMAHTILLDWGGFTDKDGTEIPYSIETAKRLLKENDRFFIQIATFSQSVQSFQDADEAEAQKN